MSFFGAVLIRVVTGTCVPLFIFHPSLSDLGHSHPTPAADGKHDKNVGGSCSHLMSAVEDCDFCSRTESLASSSDLDFYEISYS